LTSVVTLAGMGLSWQFALTFARRLYRL